MYLLILSTYSIYSVYILILSIYLFYLSTYLLTLPLDFSPETTALSV